jgi:hypothetical protein
MLTESPEARILLRSAPLFVGFPGPGFENKSARARKGIEFIRLGLQRRGS